MDTMMVGMVVIVIMIVLLEVFLLLKLYKKCPPNQALIVTGAVPGGIQVVCSGGAVVWPLITQMHSLSLATITIKVHAPAAMTSREGEPVYVEGLAHVKVPGDEAAIVKAAERFLNKSQDDISAIAHELLLSHLRNQVAALTFNEILQSRDALAQRVQEVTAPDFAKTGLVVEFFAITEIRRMADLASSSATIAQDQG
jgi:flotillin